ncbi:hypothetical protein NDI56_18000 [Haloarcula sp. S1CR25-12]|uniref:DUF2795 domain-containing protein n=1 Tax=Haloarcula saliterrae TaxID=2950534 RepID=A0ABU2FGC3_9EURY|nr:hypothetical protein [Haloarcula sp. S1CR25-12]MDS0261296.1 hypothetical protein [Haloarcula sp. S1CR25-12]
MTNDQTGGDSREQGVEFGGLMDQLRDHDYPTTLEQLLEEYGQAELELADGSETLDSVLSEQSESSGEVRYESAEEVHQSVLNMVGDRAVGRADYSDRGGSLQDEVEEGETDGDQSL